MKRTSIILIILHICLLPEMLCAQESDRDSAAKYWIRGSAGVINWNAGIGLSLNYSKKYILYSFQAVYARHQPNPELGSIVEFSPMVGLVYDKDFFSASVSTGISHITATSYKPILTGNFQIFTQYAADATDMYYGIPLSGRIHLLVDPKIALSFSAQHTFCKRDYNSFTVGIEFGNFGNKVSL